MAEHELLERVRNLDNVIVAEMMDDEFKKNILQYEMKRLEELIPFINKGMEETLSLDEAIVVIKRNVDENRQVKYTNESGFTLRNESGDIVGEMINDEDELEDLRDDPNAFFLSDNFVTYQNLSKPGEKQFFVLESESLKFITDEDLENLASKIMLGIPSTETDHFIKDCFDITRDEDIGTFIIGFNP